MSAATQATTRPLARAALLGALALLLGGQAVSGSAQAPEAGDLDRSFAGDGRKLTDAFGRRDRIADIQVQPDGHSLVAGSTHKKGVGERLTVARYERDGSLDRSFGQKGFAFLRLGDFKQSRGAAIALQPNGRIVVAGTRFTALVVVRFRRNGELDRSFGRRGKVTTNLFGLNRAEDVVLQPNGKIVVAGHTRAAGGGNDQLVLARYSRKGMLDRSFSGNGWLLTTFGEETYALAYGVALQGDGKIVVSGELGNSFIVARFNSEGTLDTSFGNFGGYQALDPVGAGRALDLLMMPDGAIMVAGGDCDEPSCSFALVRFLADGRPDPAFGDGGLVRTPFGDDRTADGARALLVQPDGKFVLAGSTIRRFGDSRFAVARYLPGGELDPSFSGDGKRTVSLRPGASRPEGDYGEAAALTPKGRIVIGGYLLARDAEDFALVRLLGAA